MEKALIISSTDKSQDLFSQLLGEASFGEIESGFSCADARSIIAERGFDLVVINMPLGDESGEALARSIAATGDAQVILVVKSEHFDAVSARCESEGILAVAKPLNKAVFGSALTLAKSAANRLKRMQEENDRLRKSIEDIRVINRAKLILVANAQMSEEEAHKYIERQAMDMRSTRREIAEGILRTYEL